MRSMGGVRWGLTWGLEKVKLLIIRELAINRGGLGENNKIQGFVQVFSHGAIVEFCCTF